MSRAALSKILPLWEKLVEGTASAAERGRFEALLRDPASVEALARWQLRHASLAGAGSLAKTPSPAWKAGAKGLLKAGAKAAAWKAALPLALAAVAGGGVLALHLGRRPEIPHQEAPAPPPFSVVPPPAPPPLPRQVPALPAPAPVKRPGLSVIVRQSQNGPLKVRVLDAGGGQIRELHNGPLEQGDWELSWDGKDGAGLSLPAGVYQLEVSSSAGTSRTPVSLGQAP